MPAAALSPEVRALVEAALGTNAQTDRKRTTAVFMRVLHLEDAMRYGYALVPYAPGAFS